MFRYTANKMKKSVQITYRLKLKLDASFQLQLNLISYFQEITKYQNLFRTLDSTLMLSVIELNLYKGIPCYSLIQTCISSYMKQIISPGSIHETGCSGLVHWDDPEGWDGDSGCGTHIHPWWIHVNVWQKTLQYCKVISLQLK